MAAVSLADAKSWLRVDGDYDDSVIESLLPRAEQYVRDRTHLSADDEFPDQLQTAQLVTLGWLYEARGGPPPPALGRLLGSYRPLL